MKGIEVEFRFKVDDEKRARAFLDKLRFMVKKEQKDVYYDTEDGDLYKRGIFVRLRNGESLDFKFNLEDDAHEDCDEHSFSVPISSKDSEGLERVCQTLGLKPPGTVSLEEFLRINMLRELVVIDKVRENFSDEEFTYSFDNVKGFGLFLEIESMAEAGSDLESLKRRMRERVMELNPDFIPVGYIEFFIRELDFGLYKQGKYLFDEDKS